MVEINGRHLCENCFEESTTPFCTHCGYNAATSSNDPTMLAPGSILLGKYIVGKVIGKGGFGVTYLAYDTPLNRKVAIKEYFPYGVALRSSGSPTVTVSNMENANAFKLGAEKFYDEAKLVSKFNGNPNIVGVYEFFYENDTVYFTMEYLEGHTLKSHIDEFGTLSAPQALFIAQSVSNALMAAHSSSVLHRDISPDNIILCDNGDVKLIDFGAARQVVAEHSQSFSVILKPGFAPLEQYRKKGKQGPWTDIYALGTTVYYSMTADIPEDPMSRMDEDTFAVNTFNVDPQLWEIITKATMLKIEDRYADIYELKNALNKVSFAPESVIKPKETAPEFRTALPFGATQSAQPKQTVAVGAPTSAPAQPQQPVGAPVQPQQPMGVNAPNPFAVSNTANAPAPAKRSFKSIIAIFGGIAVVAAVVLCVIFIPKALGGSDGDSSISDSDRTSKSDKSSSKTDPEPSTPTVDVPSDRVYYSLLDGDEKRIYEAIYGGLESKEGSIDLPDGDYSDDMVDIVYYKVLYDNPHFYYVNDFTKSGKTISPKYINLTSGDEKEFKDRIAAIEDDLDANLNGSTEEYGIIRYFHDFLLIENITVTERYKTTTCTSAFGALANNTADDLGFAKAFCYLVQRQGIPCVVVDGTVNGESRAWCKIKFQDDWRNVDIYGDLKADSSIKNIAVDKSEYGCFLTYYLMPDEYMEYMGYTPNSEYRDLPEGRLAASSMLGSFRGYYYKDEDLDTAYKKILEDIADHSHDRKSHEFNIGVAPRLINELWEKISNNLLDDLKKNYNISLSGYNITYEPDHLNIEYQE